MEHFTKYGIVGLGKVGLTLARDLFSRNLLKWICSESYDSDSKIGEFFGIDFYKSISSISSLPDIIIVAKSDNYIPETLSNIRSQFSESLQGKIILHLSGSKGIELFDGFENTGAITASTHPYQTFFYPDLSILKDIYWGIQTEHSFETIETIISGFGGNAVNLSHLSALQKTLYHASAVAASNYLTTLSDLAKSIANSAGINPELFIPPIMKTTLENNFRAKEIPLTGPIARGDVVTLISHIEALMQYPNNLRSYCLIGLSTADRAHSTGILSKEIYDEMNQLLKKFI